jgi:hypothetical protein
MFFWDFLRVLPQNDRARFGLGFSLALVGKLLAELGFDPQVVGMASILACGPIDRRGIGPHKSHCSAPTSVIQQRSRSGRDDLSAASITGETPRAEIYSWMSLGSEPMPYNENVGCEGKHPDRGGAWWPAIDFDGFHGEHKGCPLVRSLASEE